MVQRQRDGENMMSDGDMGKAEVMGPAAEAAKQISYQDTGCRRAAQ